MAVIVESGAGILAANSYGSVADFETYCSDRAITFTTGDEDAALIRATAAIDNKYRPRFVGYRTNRRNQGLEWPRTGAYYYTPQAGKFPFDQMGDAGGSYGGFYGLTEYDPIPADIVPVEVRNATFEVAIRELASPGVLAPDLDRGGAVKLLKAGSVSIEYLNGASALTVFTAIDQALSALLTPATPFSGKAARG